MVHDAETAARARKLRWFGLDRAFKGGSRWEQDIAECGFKYHMNNIAAAIGLAQMSTIDIVLERHRRNSQYFDERISNTRIEKLARDPQSLSSCWVYSLLVDDPKGFGEYLAKAGIGSDVVHMRNDRYSVFKAFAGASLPGLDAFASRLWNIPVGWWLTKDDRDFIIDTVNKW